MRKQTKGAAANSGTYLDALPGHETMQVTEDKIVRTMKRLGMTNEFSAWRHRKHKAKI